MLIYRCLRKILEYITGFPSTDILAKEYIWAWKYTGIRPHKIELSEVHKRPCFTFKNGHLIYFCHTDKDGFYYIGNVDMDGFFNLFKKSPTFRWGL